MSSFGCFARIEHEKERKQTVANTLKTYNVGHEPMGRIGALVTELLLDREDARFTLRHVYTGRTLLTSAHPDRKLREIAAKVDVQLRRDRMLDPIDIY